MIKCNNFVYYCGKQKTIPHLCRAMGVGAQWIGIRFFSSTLKHDIVTRAAVKNIKKVPSEILMDEYCNEYQEIKEFIFREREWQITKEKAWKLKVQTLMERVND